jgi:uncharacterized protein YutE (UPF0331/DUF86 family)
METLKSNLESLKASANWLRRSFDRCSKIGTKKEYTPEEYDAYENLTSRYARTVDFLISKVMRSIDAAELLNPGSLIDAAHRAEKRGLIDSVAQLRDLKDLRNEISHEYDSATLPELFEAVLQAAPEVFRLLERVTTYCGERGWGG